MKKNLLALSVALAVGSMSCAYAAVPQTASVGVLGGFSFLEAGSNEYAKISDKSGYAVGAYFGYDFTSWIGVETAYQYLGGFEATDKAAKKDHNLSVRGPQFALRLAYPLSETGSDVFFKAGGMYAQANYNGDHSNNWRPVVGAGVQYVFDNGLGLRAGYDHVFGAVQFEADSKGAEIESDLGYAYVGLQYTFGRPAPAPAPAPVAKPAPAPQQYNYSLDAGALFPFDGSKLSDDGVNQIAGVVADVKAQNLNDVSYDVKGYTDRIGNEQYNLKLSEKRAQAVTDALIANGVEASKVTSAGYGEADPVTGDKCDGLSRAKLIECLGPDRRVEIVVQGEGTK
ncbi:OmpA family protein [Anaerobiospirillum thomasii]|uniref:Outer membrane protein II n=1 Tax=Anaerobiospirillum thomasii TaxID=179995 RepID=A0A2X0VNB6_9GAMM|nr:OmpA family protein [Anaerobiospirillum thomasii]SPT69190.1 Outer membrane protein II [Anaerobiospirillum thomasii]